MTKNTRKASEWTNEEIAQDPSRYLAAQRVFAEDQEEARVAKAEALKSYTEADVRAGGNITPASRTCSFFLSQSRRRLSSSELKDHHLPLLLGGDLKELYDGRVPKVVSELHLDSSILDLGPPTSLVCRGVELELPSEAEDLRDGNPRHGHPGGEHPAVPAVLHVGVHEPEFPGAS
jgi:hypothetical protein